MKWLKRIKKDRFKGVPRPNGIHFSLPADKPIDLEALEKEYQNNIRNSPIFEEMIKRFGKGKAEELLKEFKVKVEPGISPN